MNMRRARQAQSCADPKPPATNFSHARADRSQIVPDGVTQTYNIGGIFRPSDAFPVQKLVVCGTKAELHKRRLLQAAQGTQNWVPWSERQNAAEAVTDTKALGAWVVVVPGFPATLVMGGERGGVSRTWWKQRMPPS